MNNTFYVNDSQIKDNKVIITGDDFHHVKDVLRVRTGESVNICDDSLTKYNAKLLEYRDKEAVFEISYIEDKKTELPVDITLFQGVPKLDKLELIIQKSTELRSLCYCTS